MIHANSLAEVSPNRPTLLTIGSFDGVHLGHQYLLRSLVTEARAQNARAAVVTFFPHPSVVLRGRKSSFYINTADEQAALLAGLGLDLTVTHPFSLGLSQIAAGEFVERLLAALNFTELWCGADFALGHNREGTVPWLTRYGEQRSYTVRVIEPVEVGGEIVSSSRVRRALAEGDVAQAAACLGRPYSLPGTVVDGSKRGRAIGVPTANLDFWDERACPARGVYACRAWVNDEPIGAVTNIGVRPTFEDAGLPVVEAHLLDFDGDLYGQTLRLDFIARLRAEQKFSGVDALLAQMRQDIANAREILKA